MSLALCRSREVIRPLQNLAGFRRKNVNGWFAPIDDFKGLALTYLRFDLGPVRLHLSNRYRLHELEIILKFYKMSNFKNLKDGVCTVASIGAAASHHSPAPAAELASSDRKVRQPSLKLSPCLLNRLEPSRNRRVPL